METFNLLSSCMTLISNIDAPGTRLKIQGEGMVAQMSMLLVVERVK